MTSLQQLGLVSVVGEEDLAVGDVLVDLVLRVLGVGVCGTANRVAEAEEVGDISCDDGDGETRNYVSDDVRVTALKAYSLTMSI